MKVSRFVAAALLIFFSLIAFIVLFFFQEESRRKAMIESYEMPSDFMHRLVSEKQGLASAFMLEHEVVVCVINSYASVSDIPQLSERQRASLPKEKLPSEDLAWYLLFFSQEGVSRIYLVDVNMMEAHVVNPGEACVDRSGGFNIFYKKRLSQENYYVLHLIGEREKQ